MNSQQDYRNNAQSPVPVIYQPPLQPVQYAHQPPAHPVEYVQSSSYGQRQARQARQAQQVQPIQYVQQPLQHQSQTQTQCQCNCHRQSYEMQTPNAVSQTRDIGDIVTSVIGEETMKETMKDEEIKMLKAQLDILDGKLSEMIAKNVKKFCF